MIPKQSRIPWARHILNLLIAYCYLPLSPLLFLSRHYPFRATVAPYRDHHVQLREQWHHTPRALLNMDCRQVQA